MNKRTMVWTAVERVHMGTAAAEALRAEAERLDARRVFILAGRHLAQNTDVVATLERALGVRHATTHVGIAPHAPRGDVLAAARVARDVDADLIVTIGGGSVTDAGKIIPILLSNKVDVVEDFEPLRTYVTPTGEVVQPAFAPQVARTICIPTTLSGGEFNALSGATDEAVKHKQGYEHRLMAPVAVILDPAVTVHTPEWLWLSTGVRSVDHAVETLASDRSDDFCDGVADSALRLLAEGLPRSKRDPGDLEGRLKCQIGAWQSMIPIVGGVPMGASHAIGHILGGTCDVPHGYTSCVMSPYVQAWNAEYDDRRQARIRTCLGREAGSAAEALDGFIRALGMPRTLTEVGVSPNQLQLVADYTLLDIWGRTNPRPISSAADVMQILQRAL